MAFQTLYLPIGVPTFDVDAAQIKFEDSKELLARVDKRIEFPDEMLLSLEKLNAFIKGKTPDLVIVQNITFASSVYITEITRQIDCPVLIWTLPEPYIDGKRLRLNSLTGAFSAGNAMYNDSKPFDYVYGSTFDEKTERKIKAVVNAAKLNRALKHLNLLQIGYTPDGFGFGRGIDFELMKYFGVKLHSVEAREMINAARTYSDDDVRNFIFDTENMIPDLFNVDRQNVFDAGRLFKAYFDYCNKHDIGAVSSRCWPDFFTDYGTPVCAVLSVLNDMGIPSACEADTYGALSLYMCQYLSGMPSFFGDLVSFSEDNNDITFWHCGMAPTTLAHESTGARVGVHCNRKIGPTLDFGCRPAPHATIFRVGRKPDGTFRFFISTGSVPDRLKQFTGTTIVVQPDSPAREIVEKAVKDGWEPHFAVAMNDISQELESLANILGIEVVRF